MELDELDFARKGPDGAPATPELAHVRLAHSSNLSGVKILRPGCNFTDGTSMKLATRLGWAPKVEWSLRYTP